MSKLKELSNFKELSRNQLSRIKGAGSKIRCSGNGMCPSHMSCAISVGQTSGYCEKKSGYN